MNIHEGQLLGIAELIRVRCQLSLPSVIDSFRRFARIFALSRHVQQCQREATAGSGPMVTKSRQTVTVTNGSRRAL